MAINSPSSVQFSGRSRFLRRSHTSGNDNIPLPTHNTSTVEDAGHSRAKTRSNPITWMVKNPLKTITAGLATVITVPTATIGAVCRNVNPEGAVAKVYGVGAAGPAVSKSLCPSDFLMANGDVYSPNHPSLTSWSKSGHVYDNGLATDQQNIKGASINGSWYPGELLKGLELLGNNKTLSPNNFDIAITDGAAPHHLIDDSGRITNPRKSNYYYQTQGFVEKVGDKKRNLTDVDKAFGAGWTGGTWSA